MPQDSTKTRLLLWDEADVASRLRDVLVAPVPTTPQADLDAVFVWLEGRCAAGEAPEAVYFTSVASGEEEARASGITRLRELGYEVHVRPTSRDSSATPSILERARAAVADGSVGEVIVASHDGAGLAAALESLPSEVTVTILGFRERASFAASHGRLGFVDLEEVPGALPAPLPRTNLYDLPTEGRALAPLRRRGRAARAAAPAEAATPTSPWSTARRGDAAEAPSAPPPSAPAATAPSPVSEPVGSALDDLLAGIRPSPVSSAAPPPARPGRVAPPNGTP